MSAGEPQTTEPTPSWDDEMRRIHQREFRSFLHTWGGLARRDHPRRDSWLLGMGGDVMSRPAPETTKKATHPCQTNPMGYIAWHEKARRLTRQKVRQTRCPICDRLMFPDEECAERMAQRAAP